MNYHFADIFLISMTIGASRNELDTKLTRNSKLIFNAEPHHENYSKACIGHSLIFASSYFPHNWLRKGKKTQYNIIQYKLYKLGSVHYFI